MELNWKEDRNLIRKLAKILLGDTLPNGKPVSSIILLDDASRTELQRWANMSDAESVSYTHLTLPTNSRV